MFMKGKAVIVTGAGTGIGKAIASKLGEMGARVSICGRRADVLDEAVQELQSKGIEAFHSTCDVSRREEVEEFFDQAVQRFGPVFALVNNAGSSGVTKVSEPDHQRWESIIGANVQGVYYCTCKALESMPEGGRIVSISSILGKFGVPGYAAYCTSKHGLVGFTKAVALEVASRSITVNNVCPGWVETAMAREGMEIGARAGGVSYSDFREQALGAVPLGKMIDPEEVADFVAFLISPAARNITGQSMNICGGQVMH